MPFYKKKVNSQTRTNKTKPTGTSNLFDADLVEIGSILLFRNYLVTLKVILQVNYYV